MWCIGIISAEFLYRMEHILNIYAQDYDPDYPVICIDERPCVLHGETILPIPMKAGQVAKYNYEYERLGTCTLFIAVEPLSGRRLAWVSPKRKAKHYTQFMQLIQKNWERAKKIRIVQDNLNTHTPASFYKHMTPKEAWTLSQAFEMNFTPKKASWLNMAEIELSAISKMCLKRRIKDIKNLDQQVQALVKERNEKLIKINWQFSQDKARKKMERHYNKVLSNN